MYILNNVIVYHPNKTFACITYMYRSLKAVYIQSVLINRLRHLKREKTAL